MSHRRSVRADVRSYHTMDVVGRRRIGPKKSVTLGVQHLFNRYYLPLYSQRMRSGNNNSRLPAAGAVLNASYTHHW